MLLPFLFAQRSAEIGLSGYQFSFCAFVVIVTQPKPTHCK